MFTGFLIAIARLGSVVTDFVKKLFGDRCSFGCFIILKQLVKIHLIGNPVANVSKQLQCLLLGAKWNSVPIYIYNEHYCKAILIEGSYCIVFVPWPSVSCSLRSSVMNF